jgi:RNA polymerase sigma-70 factor, ECF subfamily
MKRGVADKMKRAMRRRGRGSQGPAKPIPTTDLQFRKCNCETGHKQRALGTPISSYWRRRTSRRRQFRLAGYVRFIMSGALGCAVRIFVKMPRTSTGMLGGAHRGSMPARAIRPHRLVLTKARPLATPKELSDFLAEVERRAYKQALFAVRDDHHALDIVQDAMLKLAGSYAARPPAELPLLFQRILQNTIRDFFRRQKVRAMWTLPISSLFGADAGDEADPLETLEVADDSKFSEPPAEQLERSQVVALIEKALEKLPARQRQAFILRYWEELDVAAAAKIMGCSAGSVKTHCSRATHALAELLRKQGIKL